MGMGLGQKRPGSYSELHFSICKGDRDLVITRRIAATTVPGKVLLPTV